VTATVEFLDSEPNGLATMLGGIVQANLAAHPERESLLTPVTSYSIRAEDIDVAVSIRFSPGRVQVRNGVVGRPTVRVESDSTTLVGLSGVPLRFGLPDAMTKEGRAVLGAVAKRRLRVRGLVTRPRALGRLNKLLSVV